jgi:5-(carboxyamino)imidazole ribonucleotide synthase
MLDSKLRMPFVWKCTEFGYDGNGVKVIRAMEDLDHLPNVECITEEMILKNCRIVCRNRQKSKHILWLKWNFILKRIK